MIDLGKRDVLGVLIDVVDYEAAVFRVMTAARERHGFSATALAVHGVMTGVKDPSQAYRLNHLDLVTPDGQPVRWALDWLHGAHLADRVRGTNLMLGICRAAEAEGLSVYLYGSRLEVLDRLQRTLRGRFPDLKIAGAEPSKFRRTSSEEKKEIAERISDSGASVAFVGLGCPRQEVFVFEYRPVLDMPIIAVGAAFDYLAGTLREAPLSVQRLGLEWLHRLTQEPGRLWRRYSVLNAQYVSLLAAQRVGLWHPDADRATPPENQELYG
jgi:N-acetylglucosaminyldiphosphoundecaprenol N-acetyl-beta-D-mannosaminyltransferase